VSNIVVQVFEHHFGHQFYEKCPSHALPQLKCFDLLPSTSFLCSLGIVPNSVEGGLKISADDYSVFQTLKKGLPVIFEAVKLLKGRKTAEVIESDDD